MKRETTYTSFLVRLWRAPAADRHWLAQVEHIPGGEKRYFGSLEELFTFIRAATEALTDDEGPPSASSPDPGFDSPAE